MENAGLSQHGEDHQREGQSEHTYGPIQGDQSGHEGLLVGG
jgi:hypothetical protein